MKCGFCGYEFDPSAAQSSCGACPMAGGCHLIRCPRCGYEMPPESRLVGWLRKVRASASARRLTSQHKNDALDA
jgi:hypothetical protein